VQLDCGPSIWITQAMVVSSRRGGGKKIITVKEKGGEKIKTYKISGEVHLIYHADELSIEVNDE